MRWLALLGMASVVWAQPPLRETAELRSIETLTRYSAIERSHYLLVLRDRAFGLVENQAGTAVPETAGKIREILRLFLKDSLTGGRETGEERSVHAARILVMLKRIPIPAEERAEFLALVEDSEVSENALSYVGEFLSPQPLSETEVSQLGAVLKKHPRRTAQLLAGLGPLGMPLAAELRAIAEKESFAAQALARVGGPEADGFFSRALNKPEPDLEVLRAYSYKQSFEGQEIEKIVALLGKNHRWDLHLLRVLKRAKEIKTPMDPKLLSEKVIGRFLSRDGDGMALLVTDLLPLSVEIGSPLSDALLRSFSKTLATDSEDSASFGVARHFVYFEALQSEKSTVEQVKPALLRFLERFPEGSTKTQIVKVAVGSLFGLSDRKKVSPMLQHYLSSGGDLGWTLRFIQNFEWDPDLIERIKHTAPAAGTDLRTLATLTSLQTVVRYLDDDEERWELLTIPKNALQEAKGILRYYLAQQTTFEMASLVYAAIQNSEALPPLEAEGLERLTWTYLDQLSEETRVKTTQALVASLNDLRVGPEKIGPLLKDADANVRAVGIYFSHRYLLDSPDIIEGLLGSLQMRAVRHSAAFALARSTPIQIESHIPALRELLKDENIMIRHWTLHILERTLSQPQLAVMEPDILPLIEDKTPAIAERASKLIARIHLSK